MPVAVRTPPPTAAPTRLRTPQARVLAALQPADPVDPPSEWPTVTRAQLGVRAGYTAVSGTVTRAINGIHPGSSSGDPHPGLLALGLVEEVVLSIEGVSETNYRSTPAGVRAYQVYLSQQGALPQLRDAASCTNDRYKSSTAAASAVVARPAGS